MAKNNLAFLPEVIVTNIKCKNTFGCAVFIFCRNAELKGAQRSIIEDKEIESNCYELGYGLLRRHSKSTFYSIFFGLSNIKSTNNGSYIDRRCKWAAAFAVFAAPP